MSVIKVQGAGIDQVISDMKAGVAQMKQMLADMDSQLGPLRQNWEGSAREAYHQSQTKWNGQIEELNQFLTELHGAVQVSKDNYLAGEQRNEHSWG